MRASGSGAAGLAYSVIQDALHKVLKLTDTGVLGDHIGVQGGAFRNPAIHKALEQVLGRPVICPDHHDLDAGISEVNYLNRLHFFVDRAKTRA